jgi:hypothetical protein
MIRCEAYRNDVSIKMSSSYKADSILPAKPSYNLGVKSDYNNFSSAASHSVRNYMGDGMSMNADTSAWGQMKVSASSFASGEMAQSMHNMFSKAKSMVGRRVPQTKVQATKSDYSFSVAGSSMTMRDNF